MNQRIEWFYLAFLYLERKLVIDETGSVNWITFDNNILPLGHGGLDDDSILRKYYNVNSNTNGVHNVLQ